jgi:hypothetical protein
VGLGRGTAVAVLDQPHPAAPELVELGRRGGLGHHHGRGDPEAGGREADAEAVVAGRGRHHPGRPGRAVQRRERGEGSADLERAGRLRALQLEQRAHRVRRHQRRGCEVVAHDAAGAVEVFFGGHPDGASESHALFVPSRLTCG